MAIPWLVNPVLKKVKGVVFGTMGICAFFDRLSVAGGEVLGRFFGFRDKNSDGGVPETFFQNWGTL